jgi:hypothetical protein
LPTKDHFSSSWTLAVEGGKAHQLVVELVGVAAGEQAEAANGVLADADQAGGLADATAVGEVGEDGQELGAREAGAEQGRALALGEARLEGAASEQAALLALAIAGSDAGVAPAAGAVVGASGVLAAERGKVVHEGGSPRRSGQWTISPKIVELPERGGNVRGTRPKIAAEPGPPAAIETKYMCKECGHAWKERVAATAG